MQILPSTVIVLTVLCALNSSNPDPVPTFRSELNDQVAISKGARILLHQGVGGSLEEPKPKPSNCAKFTSGWDDSGRNKERRKLVYRPKKKNDPTGTQDERRKRISSIGLKLRENEVKIRAMRREFQEIKENLERIKQQLNSNHNNLNFVDKKNPAILKELEYWFQELKFLQQESTKELSGIHMAIPMTDAAPAFKHEIMTGSIRKFTEVRTQNDKNSWESKPKLQKGKEWSREYTSSRSSSSQSSKTKQEYRPKKAPEKLPPLKNMLEEMKTESKMITKKEDTNLLMELPIEIENKIKHLLWKEKSRVMLMGFKKLFKNDYIHIYDKSLILFEIEWKTMVYQMIGFLLNYEWISNEEMEVFWASEEVKDCLIELIEKNSRNLPYDYLYNPNFDFILDASKLHFPQLNTILKSFSTPLKEAIDRKMLSNLIMKTVKVYELQVDFNTKDKLIKIYSAFQGNQYIKKMVKICDLSKEIMIKIPSIEGIDDSTRLKLIYSNLAILNHYATYHKQGVFKEICGNESSYKSFMVIIDLLNYSCLMYQSYTQTLNTYSLMKSANNKLDNPQPFLDYYFKNFLQMHLESKNWLKPARWSYWFRDVNIFLYSESRETMANALKELLYPNEHVLIG